MKRHQLLAHLRSWGCEMVREGASHTIFCNPSNQAKAPVPRHQEIDNRLAKQICKQLGIPPVNG